jgi:hypothetical protein
MRGSSLKLLVCEIVAIGVATAIAVILFTFDLKITAAQEQESEDLQQQFPPSSSSSASVVDRITEIIQEIIANSTQIYDGSNSSSIDNSTSSDYLTLRWSNITHVAARASHVFNTKCQTNEIPLSGTWYTGSPQYLSVIANYPSIGGEEKIPTENSLSWTVVIFNSHESNSFPAVGGVLCKSTTIFANATTAGQLSRDEEEQQEEQSETSPTEASSLPRETESDRVAGLTATLNGDTFTRGDIITVNGTVEEREPGSFVGIEVIDPQSEIVERGVSPITADNNTFTYSFVAGEQEEGAEGEGGAGEEGQQQQQEEQQEQEEEDEEFSYIDEPMVTSGNYRMVLTYFPPGEPLEMEQVELVFEYNNDSSTTSTTVDDDDITDAEELGGGAAAEATSSILQPAAIPSTTTLFQSINDSFSVQVPEGWTIQDVNNTASALSEETTQGYGILARLCPEEEEREQQEQPSALPNVGGSRGMLGCEASENYVIHIVRYHDLDNRLQADNNATTSSNNSIMTNDNILLYHLQKLQEIGYRDIQIVNTADMTVNITNPLTNETISTVLAQFIEIIYNNTTIAPSEARSGYLISTATNVTMPNLGTTMGYTIFYEGSSLSAEEPTIGFGSLRQLPPAVKQIFGSFELIAAPEIAEQAVEAAEPADGGDNREDMGDDVDDLLLFWNIS